MTLIQDVQNQKQTNTGSLIKLLKLKTDAKVKLIVNIDIQDRLINDQTGIIRHVEFAQDSVCKVYVKFSDVQAFEKAMRSSYLGCQKSWVLIKTLQSWDFNKEWVSIAIH